MAQLVVKRATHRRTQTAPKYSYSETTKDQRYGGKVERSQRTDLEEFYPTVDLKSPELVQQLQDWQDHYNQYRPHGALQGRTPWQACLDKLAVTPFHDEVEANYDASAERIRHPDYRMDLKLARSKPRNRLS